MGGQAFSGPRVNGFLLEPESLVIVGIDIPRYDAQGNEHPRYDERVECPLREEFVLNVMALGVKKNILVTKVDGRAFVVDGRQRVRAAREANKRLVARGELPMRVPVVQQKGEESLLAAIAVATNEFNLEDTPLVKARKAQRLRDLGRTDAEIAIAFGVTPKTIQNWAKMDGLSLPVKQAVEAGKLDASAAVHLHDLPVVQQRAQLDELIEQAGNKRPTIQLTKAATNARRGRPAGVAPSRRVLRYIVERRETHALSADFVAGVAFAIGLQDAGAVSGLAAVLEAAKKRKTPVD